MDARKIIFTALMSVAIPANAFAMGNDTPATPAKVCKKGYVYSKKKKKCVKKNSAVIPSDDIKQQGWALARAGKYAAAIELFNLVSDNADPEKWNGLGYSHRKQGNIDKALAYYKKALTLDPDYVLAREYLGEGLVALGRRDLARLQLAEIASRCGTGCKEYVKLSAVIKGSENGSWAN